MHRPCLQCSFATAILVLTVLGASAAERAIPVTEGTLYAAYYVPDPIDYAGNVFLYIRNLTSAPLTVTDITMDGRSIGKVWLTDESFLGPDVRDEYIKVSNDNFAWYRVYPNPVPAGGIAEVILRMMPVAWEQPQHELAVTLAGYQPLSINLALQEPAFTLEYVGISAALDELHVYAQAQAGARPELSRLELDGQPVAAQLHRLFSGYTYAKVKLETPWQQGSFHAVAIGTADDLRAVLIRALPSPPPIGIMGHGHASWLNQYANHLFEAHIAHVGGPVANYDRNWKYGLVSAYPYGRYLKPEEPKKKEPVYFDHAQIEVLTPIKDHPALWGYFLGDEPDGRYVRTVLPRLSISRDVERANQFCRIFDPKHMTYSTINHSGYPRNVYRYGHIPDYVALHTFGVGRPTVVTAAQDHVMHTRLATRPRPFLFCCTGYSLNDTRKYDPQEMQLEVYTALAEGAKSLQWYPAHGERGLFKNPKMWNAIGAMNGVLHQVLPLLSIGTPVDKPLITGGDLLGSCILCGDRALAVILVNQDFTADAENFEVRSLNVVVRVRLPRFLSAAGVVEVRFSELTQPIVADIGPSSVEFATEVQAGKIIVIYADEAVADRMRHRHAQCLRRFAPVPENQELGPRKYLPSLVE